MILTSSQIYTGINGGYMNNRRSFLKKVMVIASAIFIPAIFKKRLFPNNTNAFRNRDPRRALVLWYSQAGHTERAGRLIAGRWKAAGLSVTASDFRGFDRNKISQYDLIAIGSPVFYLDVPEPFDTWLEKMPDISGAAVASFVTFGGPGDNQHNTACRLIEIASGKGGVPAGLAKFGNMSTFAPTWSMGNSERILKYRHLPDETTYENIRKFSADVLEKVKAGKPVEIDTEFSFMGMFKFLASSSMTKIMITDHGIDSEKCIECGICVEKCPTGAIDLKKNIVDTDVCVACMGCVNNCPVQAVTMNFFGKPVYGFNKFLDENNIVIEEPQELK